jgi:hypothetical protein
LPGTGCACDFAIGPKNWRIQGFFCQVYRLGQAEFTPGRDPDLDGLICHGYPSHDPAFAILAWFDGSHPKPFGRINADQAMGWGQTAILFWGAKRFEPHSTLHNFRVANIPTQAQSIFIHPKTQTLRLWRF